MQGTPYSSLPKLLAIDFDRTMVLNAVTACINTDTKAFHSLQINTRSITSGQLYELPLVGAIMGDCETIVLPTADYAKYMTVYYTSKAVVGLGFANEQG